VEAALAASGLPHRRLDIEVTEGILLREDGVVADTLQSLHDKGVRVSMDDFGTGYSSLTQLKAFPFDKIKIDRSLVTDIAHGPNGAVFVRAIAMLGAVLGMQTMVEGIETVEQLEHVRAEGCNAVQGYLIGKPVAVTELPRIIAKLHAQPSDFAASRSSII
jgi:EAL domain-containing protein (putative c-di-GMP-specific phosphodiesterase class I)